MEVDAIRALTAFFSASNRLYTLEGPGDIAALQVERWHGTEALSRCYQWDVYALATEPDLDCEAMLGQRATVTAHLPDGRTRTRSGLVNEAECIGYDAGLARYYLQLIPWLHVASYGRDQRAWSNQTLDTILAAVFEDYRALASWRYTVDARRRIQALGPLDYTVQYRTHDNLAFVEHLLANAGLGYSFVEDPDAPSGHTMVIFDDSTQLPEDPTSSQRHGLAYRYSGQSAELPDQLLFMGKAVQLMADRLTLLSHDYRSGQAVTASAPLSNANGHRELYDDVGPEAFADSRQAEETAKRQAQAAISQARQWTGESTAGSFGAGTVFKTPDAPWLRQAAADANRPDSFLLVDLQHLGINNLPKTVMDALARTLGPLPVPAVEARLQQAADATGYANHFRAVPRDQPWRPTLADGSGQRLNPVPTALGAQTAIVAGPEGETEAGATGPVHVDAQHRLRPIYHWQAESDRATFPTRAMQRLASDGHGIQFTPRIGQEVLVQHVQGLVHRPIILGGLYNGRGEGGDAPTPGGAAAEQTDAAALFGQASDHLASAQGNLTGGYSPAWHGAGAGEANHGHAAALSGFKTQGFDGNGANQLVMDDSDGMGRLQMATTYAATQLNLGHIRHQADNYLGSFRGQGFELRSDAYGALRGNRGVLLSTYALSQGQPMGEVSGPKALLQAQLDLAKSLDQAAETHATAPLAAQRGVLKADQSQLDSQAAPLKALDRSFATTVGGDSYAAGLADAAGHATDKPLPHTGDAVLGLAAAGGQGLIAGQQLHWAAGETLTLGSGQDVNLAVGQQLRLHAGQGLGWLAGASQAEGGVGLKVISGKDHLDIQAQHDTLALRSRDALKLVAANANLSATANKTIHLAVSGGASMTMEGGNLRFECPGKITVYAAAQEFLGPNRMQPQFARIGDSQLKRQGPYMFSE